MDQYWTDLLSPASRQFIIKSGLMAVGAGLTAGSLATQVEAAEQEKEQKRKVFGSSKKLAHFRA